MSKTTLQQAMQMAGGSWPSAWEVDTHEALAVLAARVRVLETELHDAMRLANAAPDLLAVVKDACDYFECGNPRALSLETICRDMRAAIAKAKGKA